MIFYGDAGIFLSCKFIAHYVKMNHYLLLPKACMSGLFAASPEPLAMPAGQLLQRIDLNKNFVNL